MHLKQQTDQGRNQTSRVFFSVTTSLDGVVEAPEEWHTPYIEEELVESSGRRYFAPDALQLGRVTSG